MASRRKKKERPINNLPGEEWALVNGTEDYYISNLARFRRGNKLRKVSVDPEGYCRVNIGHKKLRLHRLVAEYFVPNPNNLPVVDHLDTNKQNCRWDNLEWVTSKQNSQRAANAGLMSRDSTKVMAIAVSPDHNAYLFDTQTDCAKHFNLSPQSTSKVANGKQSTVGGYRIIKVSTFEDMRNEATKDWVHL